MLSDGIYASMLLIPWGTPNAPKIATTAVVAAKGVKAISDGKPKTVADLILKLATTLEPIITYMYPPVGGTMEVIINLAKLYKDSKLTNANKELYTDLVAAFVPAIKLVHKKTGIGMEVLVNASKTETGGKVIKLLKITVSNFIKPNKDKKLDKEWQEIDTIAKSAWSIKLGEAIDTESPKSKQFIQDLAEGMNDIMKDFEKLWKESNPKSVNDFEKLWKESNNDFDGIYGHYYTQQSVHPLGDYTGTCITIQ